MKKMRRMIAALAAAGVLTAVAIPALAADTDNSSSGGKVMYSKNNANWCDGSGAGACNGQENSNGRHCRWNNN
jgi:hypothetical protein